MTKQKYPREDQLLNDSGAAVIGGTVLYAFTLLTTGWWEAWPAHVRGLILLGLVVLALSLRISGLRRRTWTVLLGLKVSRSSYRWAYLRRVAERSLESLERKRSKFVEQGAKQAEAAVAAKRSEYLAEGQLAARAEVDAQKESLIEQGRLEIRQAVAAERRAARLPIWRARRARVGFYADHDNYLAVLQDGAEVATNVTVKSENPARLAICQVDSLKNLSVEDPWRRGHGVYVAVEIRPQALQLGVYLQVSWLDLNGDRRYQSVHVAPEHLQPVPEDADQS